MPKNKRVMIIEDDAKIRDALLIFLSSSGYSVKAAETREDALRIIADDTNLHCVLLDSYMTGMKCEEFMRQLQNIRFKGQIVMLSAAHAAEDYARKCGIICVERKPLDLVRLGAVLNDCQECKPLVEPIQN
jgi:DNA-binding NtrC family response regulator